MSTRTLTIPGNAEVLADIAAAHADIIVNQNAILAEAGVKADVAALQGDFDSYERGWFANAHHLHNYARTVGSTAGSSPGLITSITAWQLASNVAANTFGAAVEILSGAEGDFGLPDAPISSYDPSEMLVTAVSANGRVWVVRFLYEQTKEQAIPHANAAAAEAAGDFSDIALKIDFTNADATPVAFLAPRLKRASKLWAKVKDSAGGGTLDFILTHLHGYAGTL